MALITDLKKLKQIKDLNTFKEGKPIIAGQVNANFEALLQANEGFSDSINEILSVINTLTQKYGEVTEVNSGDFDVTTQRPVAEILRINRRVLETSDRQTLLTNVTMQGAVVSPAVDELLVKIDTPGNYTGDIFADEAGGSIIAQVNKFQYNFDIYYEIEVEGDTQVYIFYATPRLWEDDATGIASADLPRIDLYTLIPNLSTGIEVFAPGIASENPLTPWNFIDWEFESFPFATWTEVDKINIEYEDLEYLLNEFIDEFIDLEATVDRIDRQVSELAGRVRIEEGDTIDGDTVIYSAEYPRLEAELVPIIKHGQYNDEAGSGASGPSISFENNRLSNVGEPQIRTDAARLDEVNGARLEFQAELAIRDDEIDALEAYNTVQDQQIQTNKQNILVEKVTNEAQNIRLDNLENRPTSAGDIAVVASPTAVVATTTATNVIAPVTTDFDPVLNVATYTAGIIKVINTSNVVIDASFQAEYISTDPITVTVELWNLTKSTQLTAKDIEFDFDPAGSRITALSGVFKLAAKNIEAGDELVIRYFTNTGTVTLSKAFILIDVAALGDTGGGTINADNVITDDGTAQTDINFLKSNKVNGIIGSDSTITELNLEDHEIRSVDDGEGGTKEVLSIKNGYNDTLNTTSKTFVGAINAKLSTKRDFSSVTSGISGTIDNSNAQASGSSYTETYLGQMKSLTGASGTTEANIGLRVGTDGKVNAVARYKDSSGSLVPVDTTLPFGLTTKEYVDAQLLDKLDVATTGTEVESRLERLANGEFQVVDEDIITGNKTVTVYKNNQTPLTHIVLAEGGTADPEVTTNRNLTTKKYVDNVLEGKLDTYFEGTEGSTTIAFTPNGGIGFAVSSGKSSYLEAIPGASEGKWKHFNGDSSFIDYALVTDITKETEPMKLQLEELITEIKTLKARIKELER